MKSNVRLACDTQILQVDLAKILPMRLPDDSIRKTPKYLCIAASVEQLGLIEPLVVFPQAETDGCFTLLDGLIRWMILKTLGATTAKCLVAKDNEAFTYNHKVNRMSAIQEHFMIMRAIKNGVAEEAIALNLHVDLHSIQQKRDLLEGICPEAVQILREKKTTALGLRELRKVKPMRQIEIAELLCAANNFSVGYVRALVASSPIESLVEGERGKEARGLTPEDISRMEREMESLGREFKTIEESHGKNTLNLVLLVGYLKKLTENSRISRYLSQHCPEIHAEFQKLVQNRSLADNSTN